MEVFVQQLINGLTLGSIYGLIAIGYTMVFGIIGMVNFAHGDVFMVGSFIALILFMVVTAVLGLPTVAALILVLVLAMALTGLWNRQGLDHELLHALALLRAAGRHAEDRGYHVTGERITQALAARRAP